MPTISISITGSTIVSGTLQSSLSDSNLSDVMAWGAVAFNQYLQANFNAAGSSAYVATNPQIAKAWAANWWSGTAQAVTKFNHDNAVSTVVSSGIIITST